MHTRFQMSPEECSRQLHYARKVLEKKGRDFDWRPAEEAFTSYYQWYPTPDDGSCVELILHILEALESKNAKTVAYIHEMLCHSVIKHGNSYQKRSGGDMSDLGELYIVFSYWSSMLALFVRIKRGHVHNAVLDAEISLLG